MEKTLAHSLRRSCALLENQGNQHEIISHHSGTQKKEHTTRASLSHVEEGPFNYLDRMRDELRELKQRWDNRLILESLNPLEDYAQHRIAIALNFRAGEVTYHGRFFAGCDHKSQVTERLTVAPRHDLHFHSSKDGNEQSVFIGNIQCVEGIQSIIPSSIWLYILNNAREDIEADSLYYSTKSGYCFLPRFPNCELGMICRGATGQRDQFICNMVQGGAQVVDRIANDQRNIIEDIVRYLQLQSRTSRLRVFLNTNMVDISLRKSVEYADELLDVLIGPFDL